MQNGGLWKLFANYRTISNGNLSNSGITNTYMYVINMLMILTKYPLIHYND